MNRDKFTPQQLKQIDKAREYWGTTLEDLLHAIEDTHEGRLLKLLAKEYRRSQREIKQIIEGIYFKMLENGGVSTTELYLYGRMKALSANINKELRQLGKSEVKVVQEGLEQAYVEALGKLPQAFGLADFAMPNKEAIKRVIMTPWLNRTFSDSIWQNKTKMVRVLEKELLNCVSLGYSKDKAIYSIMSKTGSCFNDAERLVRTELVHTLNSATNEVAKKANYGYKSVLIAKDERTCLTCGALDGDVLPIEEDVLPIHPRCRCTYIYLKDYQSEAKDGDKVQVVEPPKNKIDQLNKNATKVLQDNYKDRVDSGINFVPLDKIETKLKPQADFNGMDERLVEPTVKQFNKLATQYKTTCTNILVDKVEPMTAPAGTELQNVMSQSTITFNKGVVKDYSKFMERMDKAVTSGHFPNISKDNYDKYVITHEFTHTLMDIEGKMKNYVNADTSHIAKARKEIKSLNDKYKLEIMELSAKHKQAELNAITTFSDDDWKLAQQLDERLKRVTISEYASVSTDEFMAEGFTDALLSENPSSYSLEVKKVIDKYFK